MGPPGQRDDNVIGSDLGMGLISGEFLRLCSGGEVAVKDDFADELSSPSPPDIRRH